MKNCGIKEWIERVEAMPGVLGASPWVLSGTLGASP